jgi:hypothetical protein
MSTRQAYRVQHRKPHLYTCQCGKVYSPTRDEARRLRREIAGPDALLEVCRFYECDHGGWHWTRRVPKWSE